MAKWMQKNSMSPVNDLHRHFLTSFALATVIPTLLALVAVLNANTIYQMQGPWGTLLMAGLLALALTKGYVMLRAFPQSCQKLRSSLCDAVKRQMPENDALKLENTGSWRPDASLEAILKDYRERLERSEREKADLRRALVDSRLRSTYTR